MNVVWRLFEISSKYGFLMKSQLFQF